MNSLHIHSSYSMLSGGASVSLLCDKLSSFQLKYAALTDTDGMNGFVDLYRSCQENNLKPVFGTFLTSDTNDPDEYLIVIARNPSGYKELCALITSRKLKEDFTLEKVISSPSENLTYITPSQKLLNLTPGRENVLAEIRASKSKSLQNKQLLNLCKSQNTQYVLTNPVYFLNREDYILHRVLTAIRLRKTVENLIEKDIVPPDYYLKNPGELKEWVNEYRDGYLLSEQILKAIQFEPEIGHYKFPSFTLPPGEDSFSFLWKIAFNGFEKKVKNPTKVQLDRLKYELEVIAELNFIDYFLVVWDIVREAKVRGIQVIGRGSAGNSLVAYALDLVDINPTEYDLYFERFLNRGRISPPDVDLDFSWKERDEMIKYIFKKYGYHRVAMISTTVTFRARSAFRETAKAFGIPDSEISKYSKFIPWTSAANLQNLTKLFPDSKNLPFNKEPWQSIINIASRLTEVPRFLGIHPGGLVIAPERITDHTALQYSGNKGLGIIVTQPDMYSIEDLGLIKIDLLSQRSLGVLRDTLRKIKK